VSEARAPLAVIVLGAALLFPLQARIDAARASTPPPDVLQTLPPKAILPILALGHREAAADLLEVRATNFLMRWLGNMSRMRHEHVTALYDAILTLDPRDPGASWRAAVYLYCVADRSDLAAQVLDRAIAPPPVGVPLEHPERWRLHVERASLELLRTRDQPDEQRLQGVRFAAETLLDASRLPAAPQGLREIGEKLLRRGQTRLEALAYAEQLWRGRTLEGEPPMRARARERLAETQAAMILEALRQVAAACAAEQGAPAQSIIDLIAYARGALQRGGPASDALKVLRERGAEDPLGYGFRVLPDGEVVAPALEARELQRALEKRLLAWKQRTGRMPAPEDIDAPAQPPPYLHVTIGEQGVRVETVR
jgi:hypothetical protein